MIGLFGLVCMLACVPSCYTVQTSVIDPLLRQLANKVANLHMKSSDDAGLYQSKISFHLPPKIAIKRIDSVYDDAHFTSMWIAIALIEASMYSAIPLMTVQELNSAVKTFEDAHDGNAPGNSSLMTFYVQTYNATSDWWETPPLNIHITIEDVLLNIPEEKIRQYLQSEGFPDPELLARTTVKSITEHYNINQADFDCSFVNLGLGALLAEMNDSFPTVHAQWMQSNPNPTSIMDSLKRFAYRPFATNQPVSAIDPRSYYVMRHFLHDAEAQNKDVGIITTWAFNQDSAQKVYNTERSDTFTANDVDIVVCSNSIYGITAAILFDLLPANTLDDPELQMIYHNTTAFLDDQIRTNFSGRIDLGMSYYVYVNQFYWFLSRTLSLLERFRLRGDFPHPVMLEVYDILKDVLRGYATQELLSLARPSLTSDEIYFDGIGGEVDTNTDIDDRLTSTGMTVNALLNIWSVYDPNDKTTSWVKDTPVEVQETVAAACAWLVSNIFSEPDKLRNMFFKGRRTGPLDFKYWYPSNRMEFLNGTKLSDDGEIPDELFFEVVEGVIPEVQYQVMLNTTHFGLKTPVEYHGRDQSFFYYWSSDAITYVTTLLALAQHNAIEQNL